MKDFPGFAAIPESVIMKITGHSTMEMFNRYNTFDNDYNITCKQPGCLCICLTGMIPIKHSEPLQKKS
ncbi:hypothetical protein FIM25_06105 [Desulfobotulus mexicanus]|uniref:Uncharacterized protein n=1 Tax=Desulfobotulus mexicanus TaxID=2586642 RepID=A0A5Q4VE78_9BACT|nr:hypothetical protein FIM25_06105 [Desulfobotulus mexicanus]